MRTGKILCELYDGKTWARNNDILFRCIESVEIPFDVVGIAVRVSICSV